jgi:hypothetical protein
MNSYLQESLNVRHFTSAVLVCSKTGIAGTNPCYGMDAGRLRDCVSYYTERKKACNERAFKQAPLLNIQKIYKFRIIAKLEKKIDKPAPPKSQGMFCFLLLTFILLMWRIERAPNSIQIYSYIQQDAALHSLFISGNCSTCFCWYFHP